VQQITTVQPHRSWIIVGGCCLAFLGAAVNACYLIQLGTSVSHLTGDLSKVAMKLVEKHHYVPEAALNLITATLGFVIGAATAGFVIHHPNIEFSRPYGRAVIGIGICLSSAHFSFEALPVLSIGLAGCACGFQNGLATHYRGIILRTTHVTELLTDLGTNLGMKVKGHQVDRWKLWVPAFLVMSFFTGALFGSMLIIALHRPALLVIASLYITGGIGWSIYKHACIKSR
jgi:uncharacterized membrane protein YoaK (UPF0700 family)